MLQIKMIRFAIAVAIATVIAAAPDIAAAQASNWKSEARKNLTIGGEPLTLNAAQLKRLRKNLRCVKLNNYGCVKQGRDPWVGSIGQDGAKHAIFSQAGYSVRAITKIYCTYYKRWNRRTVMQIAETYSPWCDTLGSVRVRNGWARTCRGSAPPPGLKRCAKPANGIPKPGQCASCNCPNQVATAMANDLGVGVHDDLKLFAPNGTTNIPTMSKMIRRQVRIELGKGLTPTDAVINSGISLAGLCKKRN